MKSALLPHSRLLSCGIEQCAEDKCFYERETHRPFPPRQMSSRRSHVCANSSICMFMCEQNSDMALQQTDVCEWESEPADKHYHSHLSVRMETGKQQSSQTQTRAHSHPFSPVLANLSYASYTLISRHIHSSFSGFKWALWGTLRVSAFSALASIQNSGDTVQRPTHLRI